VQRKKNEQVRRLTGWLRAVADAAGLVGPNLRRLLILPLDRFVHFAAVDRYLPRRFDAQPYPVASHVDDRHDHVIADHDAFVALSG
jgi:hypothetical protein